MSVQERMYGYAQNASPEKTVTGSQTHIEIPQEASGHLVIVCGPNNFADGLVDVPALQSR